MDFAAIMDAGAQPGIADQVFGVGEAVDVADGCQHGHGRDQGKARQLDQEGGRSAPGFALAEAGQLALDRSQLLPEPGQGCHIMLGPQALAGRDIQVGPPGPVLDGEEIAGGRLQMVTVQQTVKSVFGCRLLFDERMAMGKQRSQFAHVRWWHPDFWDQVGGQQFGQLDRIVLIGLDGGGGNPLDLERVGHHGATGQGCHDIVTPPGVAGGFHYHGILGAEMGRRPGWPVIETDATGGLEHQLLLGVDGGHDCKVLVEVNADETGDVRIVHERLLR